MTDATFRLRFEEDGAEIPERARGQLLGLAAAQRQMVEGFMPTALAGSQADQVITQVGTSSIASARGLSVLRSGLTALAFEATGTAGPLGRIASGLLLFGAGSTIVIGAAAGIGMFAGAVRFATRDVRELAEQNALLAQTLQELQAKGRPNVSIAGQLFVGGIDAKGQRTEPLIEQLAQARQLQSFLEAGGTLGGLGKRSPAERAQDLRDATDAANTLQEIVDRLMAALREARLNIREATTPSDAILNENARARAQADLARVLGGAPGVVPIGAGTVPLRPITLRAAPDEGTVDQFTANLAAAQDLVRSLTPVTAQWADQIKLLQLVIEETHDPTGEFSAALEELRKQMGLAGRTAELSAAQMITAFAGIASLLVSGGSPGGILSAIGGIVGIGVKGLFAANPVLGALIGAGGQLVNASQPSRVHIDGYSASALTQLRGILAGPQNVSVFIVDPDSGRVTRVLHELAQRENVDAVSRVPGPPGFGG